MFSQNIIARDGEYTKTVYTLVNTIHYYSLDLCLDIKITNYTTTT